MRIKNKLESIKKINELELNRFPEALFYKNEESKVIEFVNKYPTDYYAIRDKSKSNGIFKLKVPYDKVLDEIKQYDLFTINVSSINYANNQLLVGEIEFLSNNSVYATLSNEPGASVRDALQEPTYNLKTDILDKKLDIIRGFNDIYKYAIDNRLKDVIIEFAVFDKEVGIKDENVIIYEIRTDY